MIETERYGVYEQLVRAHNYPAESRMWGKEQVDALGMRAFLLSDMFAAYRRSAYRAAGGFDHPILTNEDMLMAQKLPDSGFLIAYAGDACVYHSHDFTWKQQFRGNRRLPAWASRNAYLPADTSCTVRLSDSEDNSIESLKKRAGRLFSSVFVLPQNQKYIIMCFGASCRFGCLKINRS